MCSVVNHLNKPPLVVICGFGSFEVGICCRGCSTVSKEGGGGALRAASDNADLAQHFVGLMKIPSGLRPPQTGGLVTRTAPLKVTIIVCPSFFLNPHPYVTWDFKIRP